MLDPLTSAPGWPIPSSSVSGELRIPRNTSEEGQRVEQTAGIAEDRRRSLRRNLVLVASYLAIMSLIALGYQ
jgi:hypothetical protein